MSKVDIGTGIKTLPTDAELTRISSEASKGSDLFLADADRRSRSRISPRTNIAVGSIVSVRGEVDNASKRVVSPGRGEGWVLLAWRDGEVDCFGTYHESSVIQ